MNRLISTCRLVQTRLLAYVFRSALRRSGVRGDYLQVKGGRDDARRRRACRRLAVNLRRCRAVSRRPTRGGVVILCAATPPQQARRNRRQGA